MADFEQTAPDAWGGIGGSGKHAPKLMAELVRDQRTVESLKSLVEPRVIEEIVNRTPQVAWGGIGGSGRHALDLEPERR